MLLRNEAQQSGNLAAGLRGSNFNMLPIEKMALELAKNFAEVNLTVNALLKPGTRIAQEFEYLIQIPGQTLSFVIPAFDRKSDRTLRPALRAMTNYHLQKAEEETVSGKGPSVAEAFVAPETDSSKPEAQERYLEDLLDIVVQQTQEKDYSLRKELSSPTTERRDPGPGRRLMSAMVSSTAASQSVPPGRLGLRRIPLPKFPPTPDVGPSALTTSQAPASVRPMESFNPISPISPKSPHGAYRSIFFGSPIARLVFEDEDTKTDVPKSVPTTINCA